MSDVAALTAVVLEVATRAEKEGWLDRFLDMFRKTHRVVLLGSTGVGKSNFIKSLVEPLPEIIDSLHRTHFTARHHLRIAAQPFEFVDTPGHLLHPRRSSDLWNLIRRRNPIGVISLVAFGYHEYDKPGSIFDAKGEVREEFLASHRAAEAKFVGTWSPVIMSSGVGAWMITLVSKADLWWDRRIEVQDFYSGGEYVQAFSDGGMAIPPVLFYSSLAKRFYSRGETSPGFDDAVRKALRVNLFRTIFEAVGRLETHARR